MEVRKCWKLKEGQLEGRPSIIGNPLARVRYGTLELPFFARSTRRILYLRGFLHLLLCRRVRYDQEQR